MASSLDLLLNSFVTTADQNNCSAAAGLLQALELEALGSSNRQANTLSPSHSLALLLFCFRAWQNLGTKWGKPYTELTVYEG